MRRAGFALALVLMAAESVQALEAGAAKVEITPPVGTPLNGYGARMGRDSLGVHDPLYARCVYLSDGQTSVFLVTSDLCLINRELRERVLQLAPKEVPRENIILTATHTHSGQGAMVRSIVFRFVSGRFIPEVLEQTAQRFAEAMRAAYDGRKRAAIGYTTIEQRDLSTNRRYDNGPIDPQIGVIRVDDGDGNPMAVIANFAAHPTTVDDKDLYLISADYPGYFYTHLEQLEGGKCIAMFMNGAEANQRPTNPENKPDPWERTESIGRLLAERVKAAADSIKGADLKLHAGYATPELPRTIASTIAFPSTVLQTLEIGDLLLTFVPGEACVEIGLELRKRALARGYSAQFTVDLSNDFLAYFVPPEYYSHLHYETAMNFYGPLVSEWLYREFSKLMTRGEPEPGIAPPDLAAPEAVETARRLNLRGTPYEIGYQRGAAFRDEIQAKYNAAILEPLGSGALLPSGGSWRRVPSFLDATPLALLTLAVGVRPLLQGVSRPILDEIAGVADGAGLPFDGVWLVQSLTVLGAQPNADAFYRAPFCTMFASTGDRAGADDLLVGRNLDWVGDEKTVILDVTPRDGHRFVQIGFPWSVGTFTGMNDAGLVLCAERGEAHGIPPIDGAPIEFVLRDLLETADDTDQALARLQAQVYLRGYHVLVAGPAASSSIAPGKLEARVIEFGSTVVVREPVNGFLMGVDPASTAGIDDDTRARYARVAELVVNEHIIASGRMKTTLADAQHGGIKSDAADELGRGSIWNRDTKYSVVFEPGAKRLDVAFPDKTGQPGKYVAISLKGDAKQ